MFNLFKPGNQRGQLNIFTIGQVGVAVGVAVIMLAVFAIVLAAFGDSTTDSNASAVIDNGKLFMVNLTSQLGTVGTDLSSPQAC